MSRTLSFVMNPNWLLATMAQSAAALVAIVGGFLVSRVVTLSSERQGLEQRGRELEQRMQGHQERLQENHPTSAGRCLGTVQTDERLQMC